MSSGVKIRRQQPQALTDLNKATVLKRARPLADTQEPRPLISLNMVVCLNNKDLSQPDRWLILSLQANILVSKVDMARLQLSHQDNIQISKWDTEVLPVLVGTAAVLSQSQMLNGVRPPLKALEMVSAVIRDDETFHPLKHLP
jgi:hypothetical protein